MTNIIKNWNNKQVRFREDGYGCLTDMAEATGKKVNNFLRSKSTKEYLTALSVATQIRVDNNEVTRHGSTEPAWLSDTRIRVSDNHAGSRALIEVIQGIGKEEGTWAHRRVCIRFAQWCSPEFSVQVDTWIEELLLVGTVSISQPIAPQRQPLNIFNLEKETLGKLSLLNFAKLFPDSPTLEGINLAEIVSDLNLIHPELANIPGQALMHVFSLFAIANKISSRKYFFTVQGREFGVRNTRYNYEVMASRSEEALSAQQFQAQIDRTQLAAAPTQKQIGR